MRIAAPSPLVATTMASLPLAASPASAPELIDVQTGVDPGEARAAFDALGFLPPGDRALLARSGVRIELLDTETIPEDPRAPVQGGGGGAIIGATQIDIDPASGRARPSIIRIAARPVDGTALRDVILHETGHAVSVLRSDDRSEDAAELYAFARMAEATQLGPDGEELVRPPYASVLPGDAGAGAGQVGGGPPASDGMGALTAAAAIGLLALAFFVL